MLTLMPLLTSLMVAAGESGVLETTIKYVGAESAYLNAGSSSGVQRGDSAEVWSDDQIIARLVVVYVAASSSSAQIIESSRTLRIGDRVRLSVSASATPDSNVMEEQLMETPGVGRPVSGDLDETFPRRPATRIRGRVAAQFYHLDDQEESNNDVTRPALVLRATVENLFTSYLKLSVNVRARQIIRSSAASPGTQSEWSNRIYEIALQYDDPASPLNFQMGRIASNAISGIGIFDGAMVEYGLQNGWSAGVFGGTRPDLSTSEPNTDETTAGLYAAYNAGTGAARWLRTTLALAGRYQFGEIDEEFLYVQTYFGLSRRFLVTQSAEISINRGWREQAEGSALGLSNVLINASYSPWAAITIDAGYDNRTQVRTYETKDTPDSLFDDALRQGFRAGISANAPLGLRVWLRGTLRIRETGETDTRTASAGLSRRNVFNSGISTSMQFNLFQNRLSSGNRVSVDLARHLLRILYLQLEAGSSRYQFTTTEGPVSYHWFQLAVSANLTHSFYTSAYGELYRGDAMKTNRFEVELGYRF